jgi:hypothetical protein
MAKPDILIVDGHAFSWQRLCDLRRQQTEAWKKSKARQPALFEFQTDYRPAPNRQRRGGIGSRACLAAFETRFDVMGYATCGLRI